MRALVLKLLVGKAIELFEKRYTDLINQKSGLLSEIKDSIDGHSSIVEELTARAARLKSLADKVKNGS